MAENLRKARQNRVIDAYLHHRQKEFLELARHSSECTVSTPVVGSEDSVATAPDEPSPCDRRHKQLDCTSCSSSRLRTQDDAAGVNADGVMFIDTAKQHLKERGTFTEAELKALAELTPHRAEQSTNAFQVELEAMADGVVRESDRWMEELLCSSLTSFEEGMDPVQKRTRVAQLILERAQTQCMTCGKAGRSVEQQCLSCHQQTGRVNTGEDVTDATDSIVMPVILRSAGAPENAHHYCRTEDVLCNISDSWRKEIEEICGVDTPRAREVALCMIRPVVTEPTPVLQAVWLDQFLEFERMNGGDEWWCECLPLVGTEEQRSDAAMDTIDEVISWSQKDVETTGNALQG